MASEETLGALASRSGVCHKMIGNSFCREVRVRFDHARCVFTHFANPLLILLMRLGLVELHYFLFKIRKGLRHYEMLGRPVSAAGGDISILREVLIDATYEPILPLLPSTPLRLVDIGANIGAFTVWLQQERSIREGFCFEPDPDSHNLCRFNLQKHNCDNVSVYALGVGETTREAEIWSVPNRPAQASIYQRKNSDRNTRTIRVVGFTDWLDRNVGDFDLLKIDCEGAEWEIVESAAGALRRFGVIVAEVQADPTGRHHVGDFPGLLSRHGFTTVQWDGHEYGLYVGRRD
jgi:FkbM family methyltransferase